MKTRILLVVVLAVFAVAGPGCKSKEPPCVKDSMKNYEGGKVSECVLEKNYEVGGVKCAAKEKIQLNADGSLKSCDLAEPVEIQGFPCKSGTLSFDDKGKVYFCSATSKDIKVGDVVVPEGSLINPFGSGKVKFAECKGGKTATYKELTCREVFFDNSSKLTKCILAADSKWKGKNLKAGTEVKLEPGD